MRTTPHLLAAMRIGLERGALDRDTMGELLRATISSGLLNPLALAAASVGRRSQSGGVRTTLDVPHYVRRTLKRLAAVQDTSLQALVVAAILQTHPGLA